MLDSLFIFWLNICAACIFAPQFTFISQPYTNMAKSTKTEQEAEFAEQEGEFIEEKNEALVIERPALKPGFMWIHNLKTGTQRQIKPGNDRHGKALEKHGYKKGPLPEGWKKPDPKEPVEAETI